MGYLLSKLHCTNYIEQLNEDTNECPYLLQTEEGLNFLIILSFKEIPKLVHRFQFREAVTSLSREKNELSLS